MLGRRTTTVHPSPIPALYCPTRYLPSLIVPILFGPEWLIEFSDAAAFLLSPDFQSVSGNFPYQA